MPVNPYDQFLTQPAAGSAPKPANPYDAFMPGYTPPPDQGDFGRGIKVALGQTMPIVKGVVGLAGASAENLLGEGGIATAVKNWGLQGYQQGMEKLQPLQKDTDELTTAWDKAKGGDLGALVDWVQYGLGYAVGQGGEALATSLIGGIAGGAASGGLGAAPGAIAGLVGKGAVKEAATGLIKRAVLKEAEELIAKSGGKMAADEAAKLAVKSVAKDIGSTTALLAYGAGQELGSIYPEAEAEAAKKGEKLTGMDLARVWGTGLAAGGIEALTDKLGIDVAMGKMKIPGASSRLGSAALTGGAGALTEGVTEGVQTAIERVGAGQEVFGAEGIKDIINSAGLGAVGGGGIGGGSGLLHGGRHGDPAAVARSDQAMDDLAGATNIDEALDAFNRTHVPLSVPTGFDAEGAMARMERMRDSDVAGLKDWNNSSPSVTTPADVMAQIDKTIAAPAGGNVATPADARAAEPVPADAPAAGQPAPAEPTDLDRLQAGVPQSFQERLQVVRDQLEDTRVQQRIRDNAGPAALHDALFMAKQADDVSQPGKTSDDMLAHAERILDMAGVAPLKTQVLADAKARGAAEKRAATAAKEAEKAAAEKAKADAAATPEAAPAVADASTAGAIDEAAHAAAPSPKNNLAEPTDAQKEAGNYQKGHITIGGLAISVENPEGSERSGTDVAGNPWKNTLRHHYGYIKGTIGQDGEHIDTFIKPGTKADYAGTVFVVDQIDPATGKPDEHKVMLGFDTIEEARAAYQANYAKGWKGLKTISATPMAEFKQWLATDNTLKPFHQPSLKERAEAMKQRAAAPEVTEPTGNVATPQVDSTKTTSTEGDAPVDLGPTLRHTIAKGKDVFGWVLKDATDAQARAIDPYTFKKDDGYFIRERHQDALEAFERARPAKVEAAPAPAPVAAPAPDSGVKESAAPAAPQVATPEGDKGPTLKERADAMKERAAAPAEHPAKTLGNFFATKLAAGLMPKDNPALKKMVAEFDGKEPTQARMKEAQETLEASIVRVARITTERTTGGTRPKFDALVKLYQSQPLLNVRTSTSIENQAYSTPAPLALLASDLAGITSKTTVLEPTAGTGMLLIQADPNKVIANELNPFRNALLKDHGFAKVTDLDATSRVTPLTVDRVIANPPFGPLPEKVKVDGYTFGQIDHLIAARALEAMKDDGRATLIIGANKVAGGVSNQDLIFFNWLYGHYNVTSHFEVDGKLYERQGAGWPVRVITIEGREKSARISPAPGVIQRAFTWDEVYEHYEQGLATGRAGRGLQASPSGATAAGADVTQPVRDAAGGEAAAPDRSRPEGGASGDGNVAGQRAEPVGDRGAEPAQPVGQRDRAERPGAGADRQDRLGGDAGGTGAGKPAGDSRTARVAPAAGALTPAENEFQAAYTPRSSRKDAGVLIPVNMRTPTEDALSRLEDAVGDIDEYARKQLGYDTTEQLHDALMGLQVDSVASAIYQMSREKGTIIADQTGIGKGRQAAAIIRWAVKNGRIPIFMSVKPSLFTDMYGDLHDIGTDDVAPLLMNSTEWIKGAGDEKLFANKPSQHRKVLEGIAASGMLPEGRNALFSTYSQINVQNVQRSALEALAPRAIFVLDESHNAGGESATGAFVKSMLDLGKGVVYLSATYAKRPDNMPLYYKTDMGEAVADDATLMSAMEAGGLPLQTVVSNNLVKAGQMFRRERSFDGVEIRTETDTANRELHEKQSDAATEALRGIVAADRLFHEVYFKERDKEAKKEGARAMEAGNGAAASVNHTEFSSVVHNFVRQMLLGLEAGKAADLAIAALQQGQKPLIALENTMGSFLVEYADANKIKVGDSLGNFDYRNVLSRALERTRYITIQLPNGDKVKEYIPLSKLDGVTLQAYTKAQEVIDGLKLDIPVSPIDWMRDKLAKAGFSVAEITGRNLMVDYSDAKVPKLAQMDATEQKDKVRTTRQFNSGKLDAIILNVAGSTGISLHASEKFTDQRQRKMIVAQAAQDINIFMQMLGRIHRTGQVALPSYTLLNADLPAVKRPTALLSKKMQSLNANTSANTESATSVKAFDMLNKYGDQVVGQYLSDNPLLARDLGLTGAEMSEDEEAQGDMDIARKATGRLALLPVERQREVYADLEQQYGDTIDFLNRTNQNDLEPRTADFDARELRSQVLFEGQNPETPFGQDAIYNEYSIKAQGVPPKPEEVRAAIAEHLAGAKNGDAHVDALIKSLNEQLPAFTSKLDDAQRDTAMQVVRGTTDFMRRHPIGSGFRIEVNGEPYAAVVTNIRNTHKAAGNPFSMSKVQVTLAVSGALRSVTVPATRFNQIETSRIGAYQLDSLFKEGPKDERQVAKIVTGNLLGAYGELQGVKGTIISFTKEDGTVDQGILLPKHFEFAKNTAGDFRLPTGEAAALFLRQSINKDIGKFGIQTRDGIVRVVPDTGGIVIRVPKSKAKGGKFFLDEKLRAAAGGDFISKGSSMEVHVDQRDAAAALDVLMKKQALYTLPSMAREARDILGETNQKKGTATVERLQNPDREGQAPVNATSRLMQNAASAAEHLASNSSTPWVREVARTLAPFLDRDTTITYLKSGDKVMLPKSVAATIQKGGIFGLSEVDPISGKASLYMRYDESRPVGEQDLLHELLHAATQRALAITKSAPIRAEFESIRAVLQRTFDHVLTSPRASETARNDAEFFRRTITDSDELLAYGLTSKTFRQWAQNIDATGRIIATPKLDQGEAPKLTLWQKFVDGVRQLIGLSKMYAPRLQALLERREADRLAFRTANTPETLARRLDTLLQQTLDLKVGAQEYSDNWTPGGNRRGTAYHGTPHQVDAFSLNRVGTGEGSQSFGYGLYFAGKREVAEFYRDSLADADFTYATPAAEARMKTLTNFSDGAWETIRRFVNESNGDPKATAAAIRNYTGRYSGNREALNGAADLIEAGQMKPERKANLYQVTIPDDNELINWDATLDQQTPEVRNALEDLSRNAKSRVDSRTAKASTYYYLAAEALGSEKAASAALRERGVPGIRYLDKGSRGAKDGTSNYVIFDDSRVTINQRLGTSEVFGNLRAMKQEDYRNAFVDAIKSHGSVNTWERTVGTQYAKAEANPTTYKPVFEAVQDYIKDTSVFANAAGDRAPDILPKLDTLRDLWKDGWKEHGAKREDVDAAGKAAFAGTLKWSRDENGKLIDNDAAIEKAAELTTDQKARVLFKAGLVTEAELKRWQATPLDIYDGAVRNRYEQKLLRPGVVFSDGELRNLFKLSDHQISLYRQFLEAVNQSVDDMGRSELVRLAGSAVGEATRAAATEATSVTEAAEIISAQIDLMTEGESSSAKRDSLTELRNSVNEKANRVGQLKAEGYAPLMRFGEHTVHVVDKKGESLYFGMFESDFFDRSMDANKMARAMRDAYPQATVTQGKMSQEKFKLFQGIDLNALELFAEATGEADNKVYQDYLRMAKNNRSAMKRLIERKGTSGYNENARRVLASFVTSNARMASGNMHMQRAKSAVLAIPKEMGDLSDEASKLVNYVQNPGEEAAGVRGLLFTNFIGGSVASALVNLTQPFTMTLPYLSQYGGAAKAGKALLAATKAAGSGKASPEIEKALHANVDLVSPQEIHDLQAAAQAKFADHPVLKKAAFLWGSMFSLSEQFNRRVTFIAAFQTALDQQMPDPTAFARKAVIETQGLYNKGNKANWARGAIGATLMTFKQFSVHYLEFLTRMWKSGPEGKKAVGVALAIMVLTAGAGGLPFADDLDDLIDTLAQAMGYDFSSKKAKRQFVANMLGDTAADFLTRGVTGVAGMPLDVSVRMGMGNLLPATGALLRSNTDRSRDVLELAGAAGGLAKNVMDAGTKALQGDFAEAGMALAPTAIQNMAKSASMFNTGEYRNAKGEKVMNVGPVDAAVKFIGFQPGDVATESLRRGQAIRSEQLAKNVEAEIVAKWARGLNDNDAEVVKEARTELADWNAKNDNSMRVSMQQVINKVRAMRLTAGERVTKAAPREMRASVREDLK